MIGTGIMGGHMARRLALAGLTVTAWNRDRSKLDALIDAGVKPAQSVTEALAGAAVAIVMLSTGQVVQEVLFGGDEPAITAMAPGSTLGRDELDSRRA
ncbi:NAD(P)-binding domain-containing protein [Micromonospora sp. STR1s_5]|nr:NAD(P)-binding domain-containing protein [Micromonospora sp. STR1s_5]